MRDVGCVACVGGIVQEVCVQLKTQKRDTEDITNMMRFWRIDGDILLLQVCQVVM